MSKPPRWRIVRENAEKQRKAPYLKHRPGNPKSDEDAIVAAVKRLDENYQATSEQQQSNAKRQRRIERLSFRRDRRRFWIEIISVAVVFIATIVAVVAIATASHDAEGQREISRDTEHRQLRAYITASEIKVIPITDKSGRNLRWTIIPQWKNAGQTPTRWSFISIQCLPRPATERLRDIGPGKETLAGSCDFTPYQIDAGRGITNPVCSRARYVDVFGDSHISEQCFTVRFTGDFKKANPAIQFIAELANTGNCEDAECDDPNTSHMGKT